jgi:hypothetical protein
VLAIADHVETGVDMLLHHLGNRALDPRGECRRDVRFT